MTRKNAKKALLVLVGLFMALFFVRFIVPIFVYRFVKVSRSDYFVGEQVMLHAGVRGKTMTIDLKQEMTSPCYWNVYGPHRETLHHGTFAPPGMDGLDMGMGHGISEISDQVILNDLIPELKPGRYRISNRCGFRIASATIEIKPLAALNKIEARVVLPTAIGFPQEQEFKQILLIHNGFSSPIQVVDPQHNGWVGMNDFISLPGIYAYPYTCYSFAEVGWQGNGSYALNLSTNPYIPRPVLQTAAPGETYTEEIVYHAKNFDTFHNLQKWAPADNYEILGGAVIPIYLPAESGVDIGRPIELLLRDKACFRPDGGREYQNCPQNMEKWKSIAPYN